ncbi:hypothetical protein [Mediterranea massiliensis]|uniref:hypothetical protein n=1 Tax=Mediterranea massiliensis TaxID=1841865 RepID=UPI0023F31561|nr:hypothetical protein [Mediterranea massiliensis]
MKRTTYIILGVLLALLAGMSATIIYWGTHSGSVSDMTIRLEGEERMRPLPVCKVIRFQMDKTLYKYDGKNDFHYYFTLNNAHLIVTPADTATGNFSYAADMEKFMSFKAHGDTLDVVFSFPPEELQKRMPEGKIVPSFILRTSPFSLRLPESVECLNGEMLYAVELQDLQRDSLAIDFSDSPATVFVQNSRFRALSVLARQLDLVSGSVDHLYLNLDELYSFEVKTDSFRIDTEYLSGSRNVDFQADPQECRRILWNPLSKNAKLNLKMKNPSEILLRD